MKIFQLLDGDYEHVGLLKVEVPLTASHEERQKLESNMNVAVQAVSQNEYQIDFENEDELINTIANKLGELGYEAERFYVEEINMI